MRRGFERRCDAWSRRTSRPYSVRPGTGKRTVNVVAGPGLSVSLASAGALHQNSIARGNPAGGAWGVAQMLRRTAGLLACMILCWISAPVHAAKISCFNPADASGMTEPEWRAAGFLPNNEMPAGTTFRLRAGGNAACCRCFDARRDLGTCSCNGLLSGDIVKGDYERVATFLDAHRPKMFALNSNGGDVDEALKIGRLFRKFLVLTLVPTKSSYCGGEDCTCASACALIWFGGVNRGGTVGLHRPRPTDPMFGKLSPVDATTAVSSSA